MISLPKSELSKREMERLLESLTFSTDEQTVTAYRYLASKDSYRIPRGARDLIPDVPVRDLRARPTMPELTFVKQLDTEGHEGQLDALASMYEHEQGQLIRQPGSGKSQIAFAFIAGCRTRTLVLTHTVDIMDQWREYAEAAIPGLEVGTIQGKKCEIGHLTLATPQTLKRYVNEGRRFWGKFGCLIADEQQHAAAETWEWIMNSCPAFYRFGFTATERRADGMHPLIRTFIGPVIHRQPFKARVQITAKPVKTGFKFEYEDGRDYNRLQNALVRDAKRNKTIATIADREVTAGNSVLILSRRIEHLVRIQAMMETNHNRILIGSPPQDKFSKSKIKMPKRGERKQIIHDFRRGKVRCLLATQLADEAIDIPRLNRIILTYPGKHDGRIIQQVGRGARAYEGKEETIIYDCVDLGIVPLERQFRLRKKAYHDMHISIAQGVTYYVKQKVKAVFKKRR